MKTSHAIGIGFAVLLGLFALGWITQGNNFFMLKVFAPKYEQVRRETFEQSKAYNQGMIQELQNMQFEYVKADKDSKTALASIILHRASDYDVDKMPSDLRSFIAELKNKSSDLH